MKDNNNATIIAMLEELLTVSKNQRAEQTVNELNRDNAKIKQMREDVKAYEDAVKKQAALAEQARLKEQAAKELDNKAKSIKGKPIQTDKQKK